MKVLLTTVKVLIFFYLTLLSYSLVLNKNEMRFLQANTNSTKSTPFEALITELKFVLSDEGRSVLQPLLDLEFSEADINKDQKISGDEVSKRLEMLLAQYKLPNNASTKKIFSILKPTENNQVPEYTKAEFDEAIIAGLKLIMPYLEALKDSLFEELINAEGYMLEISIYLGQEKNVSTNYFQTLWLKASEGYSSITEEAAYKYISEICFSLGYPESQSKEIESIVNKHSKTNSLLRDDFETASREALTETYNYIKEKQVPRIYNEISEALQDNMVSSS